MTAHELKIYADVDVKAASYTKQWVPLVWAGTIVAKARKEGRIKDDFASKTLVDEINTLRGKCGGLFDYDWISIPLVYTQVRLFFKNYKLIYFLYYEIIISLQFLCFNMCLLINPAINFAYFYNKTSIIFMLCSSVYIYIYRHIFMKRAKQSSI